MKTLFWLLLTFLSSAQCKRGLPPDVQPCGGSGNALDECIIKTGNKLFPRLAAGELESLGLGDVNPIRIPRIESVAENEFLPGFRFDLLDTEHRGWHAARLLHSRARPDKYHFEMSLSVPKYEVTARQYDIEGRLLFFDVRSKGKAVLTFYNNRYHVDIRGEPYQKKGKRYMRLTNFTLVANIDDMHIEADGLFGFEILNDATVAFLNRNSRTIVALGAPLTQDLYGPVYSAYLARLFNSVPYDDFFPDAAQEPLDSLKSLPEDDREVEDEDYD